MERTGRQPRIHQPNTIHHVMVRGNNRQRIFFEDEHFNYFLNILSKSTEKFDHRFLAHCLMPNHAHLLVKINQSSLSSVMQNINYRYARWINYKLKRIGHLFQSRYRSLDVNSEAYLIELCRYIHLNPVAANLVSDPSDYKWSSHRYYLGKKAPSWMDLNEMTSAIKNKTGSDYLDFMSQDPNRETWKPALYLSDSGEIVIDDEIMKTVSQSMHETKIQHVFLPVDLVTSIVSKHLAINQCELYGPYKNHEISRKRALIAAYCLKYSNQKMSKMADIFQRTASTLQRQVQKISDSKNQHFSKILLQKIDSEIQEKLAAIN